MPKRGDSSAMTLDDYIEECAVMLAGAPRSSGALADFFTSIRLHKLFNLALNGSEAEQRGCIAHWWLLPVEERLKREVASQI
jgi:hypothetical protein